MGVVYKMEMNKESKTFKTFYFSCGVIVFILAFFGTFVLGVASHELTHYWDIKDEVVVADICLFNIPIDSQSLGYIEFGQVNSEKLSTETKPTIIESITILTFLTIILCFYFGGKINE